MSGVNSLTHSLTHRHACAYEQEVCEARLTHSLTHRHARAYEQEVCEARLVREERRAEEVVGHGLQQLAFLQGPQEGTLLLRVQHLPARTPTRHTSTPAPTGTTHENRQGTAQHSTAQHSTAQHDTTRNIKQHEE